MTKSRIIELSLIAEEARKLALDGIFKASSGHPGGSLSLAEALVYLYFEEMHVSPEEADAPERDRLVLSKGHAAPMLYAVLALRGYFPTEDVATFRKFGSYLQGHPDMHKVKGVDMSTGSLGQGVSAAGGMAMAGKLNGKDYRVYTILGDGELEEGQVWEQAMFASHYRLDNLTALIDNNGLQIDGKIDDVMSPYPIDGKFRAFGWHVTEAEAHDFASLEAALKETRETKGKPTVIILHSVKGKGVSFMENNPAWHGSVPSEEQFELAMNEIEQRIESLRKMITWQK